MAVSAALVAGCYAAPVHRPASSDSVVVWSGKDGEISGPAVELADGWIYFLWLARGGLDAPAQLRRVKAGGAHETLSVKSPDCPSPYLAHLRKLPEGGLGALRYCTNGDAWLATIDVGSATAIAHLDLSPATDVLVIGDLKNGWAEKASYGCSSITPMVGGRLGQAPRLQPADLLGWQIDQGFKQDSCTASGQIGFAQDAGSDSIVLMASPGSKGIDPGPVGKGRENVEWNAYWLNARSGEVRIVGGPFIRPRAMVLADGNKLAAVGGEFHGKSGLWLVDLKSGSVSLLAEDQSEALAATTDGRSLISARKTHDSDSIIRIPLPLGK